VEQKDNYMANYEFYIASSLEKVFPTNRVKEEKRESFNLLQNDQLNFQIVYYLDDCDKQVRNRHFRVKIISTLDSQISEVKLVKCEYLATENRDRYYISTDPGLYPDLLIPSNGIIKPLANQYKSLFISILSKNNIDTHKVKIQIEEVLFEDNTGKKIFTNKIFFEEELTINIINDKLIDLPIIHTQWFHCDSIANYHNEIPFSDNYWELLEKYIFYARTKCDVNMLLTPVFTPPLDTDVNAERKTIQLVDITYENNCYSFDFSKLEKWCEICKKSGIEYIEVAHLFTQWGAKCTPKIVVLEKDETGELKKVNKFGWHVRATSLKYRKFLESFIPSLIKAFDFFGYKKETLYFHISDEPNISCIEDYQKAKDQVKDLLVDCNLIDALSDFSFYENGLVEIPIPSNDHIEPFVNKVDQLWTYYCIAQGNMVPNRFIALPSYRNRVMGILLYLYNIKGFLHWGFNYWESENSRESINPFISCDGNCAFPAGDPFLIYPGPLSSLRNEIQIEAFNDLKLLCILEKEIGRENVINIIKDGESCGFTFKDYPKNNEYYLRLREKILNMISLS